MTDTSPPPMRRRDLLKLIGSVAGSSVMFQAMTTLGLSAESTYTGPIALDGDPKGASVLILGAGLAGLVAALELRKAGYTVQVLEYQNRAGGRCWTIRGGDVYTELGGPTQTCEFDKDLYLNPGPWRIPSHHHGVIDYCKRLGVGLEPFMQVNHNAYLHSTRAFGGRPQRFRHVKADFEGGIAELLAKAASQNRLDALVSTEDKALLLESLRDWGALDRDYVYKAGPAVSGRRGYEKDPGGGLNAAPRDSAPMTLHDVLDSRLWRSLADGDQYYHHNNIFQPVGGMDMIARAFAREVGSLIRYGAKVTSIRQAEKSVTVSYTDMAGGPTRTASADWCLCTIPLSILSQIEITVGAPMARAINAVPYSPNYKIGLQFKRRFWEQDDSIYGGITYTDLPIRLISYPSAGYGNPGKGVLLGGYVGGVHSYEFASLTPQERIEKALDYGSQIHPQYRAEYDGKGFSVAWHRVPWTLGCAGAWTDAARQEHYANLCAIDGRILLAGEHASYIPAWQEGAILSSLDAVSRLHQRVMAT